MTKVSIIIPVYNTEKYLRECLDSVINQSLPDIEIICINDGSSDNSLNILKEYADKDTRIIIIDKENAGVSAARNDAIDKANSEYIMFLDSDDYLSPNACEIAYDSVCADNYDVGIFGHYILKGKRLKPKYINGNPANYINIWDKIFKTSFLKNTKIKFPQEIKTAEDIIFSYTVNSYNPKYIFINELLMTYRDARKGSSTEDKLKQIKTDISAFKYFSSTEIFKSMSNENKCNVTNKFSSIIGWLATKADTKEKQEYVINLLQEYCSIVEKNLTQEDLEKIPSYESCKNPKFKKQNFIKKIAQLFK